jgi:plasmid maintenance system antidote protein VapI
VILWDLSMDSTFQRTQTGCLGGVKALARNGRGPGGGVTMRQLLLVLLGGIRSRVLQVRGSGVSMICLSLVVIGCASHSLMPAAQSEAIKDRERALASHRDVIQASVRQSGNAGALAFLDAKDGHLVVLPGDSPLDAWARYATAPDGKSSSITMPDVVTFVYRTDIPKAPETLTQSALQQQQAQRTAFVSELQRVEEQLGLMQRQLAEAMAATKQDTDKAVADMRALAEDLAAARKFMLQTAQLGWLNQEMAVENTNGIRKIAAASQELAASSTKLEESVRQLSERLGSQLKELANRLDTIQGKIQNIK